MVLGRKKKAVENQSSKNLRSARTDGLSNDFFCFYTRSEESYSSKKDDCTVGTRG